MLKAFRKFIPFSKVAEQADGTLFVYGLVTAERVDLEDEVCEYDSTKPFYQKLVTRYSKATGSVDGMESSIAPLREMHQLKAVGCGKSINFDDDAKTIHMGFHVVETEAAKKVKAGVLIGFSQGGDYVKTWKKNGNTWYTADPGEVSLVDSPCLEDALISQLVEKSFEYVKENGSTELRKFHVDPKTKDRVDERDGLVKKQKDLEQQLADLKKKLEERMSKPELKVILEKLAKAGTETITLSKEEMLELNEFAKAHAPILEHLHSMHKAADAHCADMKEHVGKCFKALGHEGPMKAADSDKDKNNSVTMTKAELDKQIADAVEKAKKPAEEQPLTLTQKDLDAKIAEALEKARGKEFDPNDAASKAKLHLVGRDGKEIKADASPRDGEDMSKSVGF